jgi:CRP/FNR family transcriptional regulator, nitrogen fixation regulation protein
MVADQAPGPDELGLPAGLTAVPWAKIDYKRDSRIFGEGDPADYVYHVKKGAGYKLLNDGRRRQIGAFHLPGDIFGVTSEDRHRFAAEAVVATTLAVVKRRILAEADAGLTQTILGMTARTLKHAESHLLLLGRQSALEKIAAFLLEMDKRMAGTGAMTLPMTRRDIADYLGLSLETVSRALAKLKRQRAISFTGNQHPPVPRGHPLGG